MKAGETLNIVQKLNLTKPYDVVRFRLSNGINTITKDLTEDSGGVFVIPLYQEDTHKLEGRVSIEAEVDFEDKSVRYSNFNDIYLNKTLGYDPVENNQPSDDDGVDLIMESIEQGVAVIVNPEASQELIDAVTELFQDTKDIAQSVRDDADAGEFDGFSPQVTVKTETPSTYILHIKDADHEYDTPNLQGQGGSGGTGDYDDLDNKPKINNVELSGNKSSSDLGLVSEDELDAKADKDDTYTKDEVDTALEDKQDTLTAGTNITIDENNVISASGGSGSSDYDDLENKPSINSTTLSGNKTASDLGLQEELIEGNYIKISDENVISVANSKTIDLYAGYTSSVSSASNYDFPFIPAIDYSQYGITKLVSIELDIAQTGTLTIIGLDRDGTSYETSHPTVKETLTFTETGYHKITFNNPIIFSETERIGFGVTGDTAKFKYSGSGTKGFYFRHDFRTSNNSLGITTTFRIDTDNLFQSVYSGKRLSILGDSISTFSGYIPSGNVTYYPHGTVTSVTDTWWKKLIDALDMELELNNSWSGSRVTTTGGTDSAGVTRASNLGGNPDVIIVYMGINDFNNEVVLGTYDGSTPLPASTETTTFREAYALMLDTVLTTYKEAEVWVCTLPQCERNSPTGFPEINGNGDALIDFNNAILELAEAFGVKVLNHNKCGLTYQNMPVYNPDELHPNKYGHSLIANNDIKEMDGLVRTRYPIS